LYWIKWKNVELFTIISKTKIIPWESDHTTGKRQIAVRQNVCRAPRQKTHGKGFAVRFLAFAVRSGRTAKPLFPVVPIAWAIAIFFWIQL
jgi:hypothetical protein